MSEVLRAGRCIFSRQYQYSVRTACALNAHQMRTACAADVAMLFLLTII
jgi:hypothetical protein